MSKNTHAEQAHPLFARLYDPVMAVPERLLLSERRASLARGLSGRVLDLGSGTGAMFPHYPAEGLTVHAVEPDPHMRDRASDRADQVETDIETVEATGENLPYPDDFFDTVVASFVLCTVQDLGVTLDELARVLEPGGEFRFLEHVRARGVVGRLHDVLAPGWSHVAGGCTLNRRTGDSLTRDERFELVQYDRLESGISRLVPTVSGRLERRRESRLPF